MGHLWCLTRHSRPPLRLGYPPVIQFIARSAGPRPPVFWRCMDCLLLCWSTCARYLEALSLGFLISRAWSRIAPATPIPFDWALAYVLYGLIRPRAPKSIAWSPARPAAGRSPL